MTIDELARRAGTSVRNVRFYITEGLLPRPVGTGRAAAYNAGHLARLETILRLRQRNLPLAEIRRTIVGVPAHDLTPAADSALDYIDRLLGRTTPEPSILASMAAPPPPPPVAPGPPPASPSSPRSAPSTAAPPSPLRSAPAELMDQRGELIGEQWRRVRIHPDVELSIREPVPPGLASRLPELIERLRRLVEGKE